MIRFGSVCSGIDAASVAWAPLGWKAAWLAEIEKFPAAVLAHHYPEECEALQGFPRSYTAIPWRNKPADQCPDGPRYKALGNSWAVPNVRWIGERIQRHLAGEL